MALEVHIEKVLADFELDVTLCTSPEPLAVLGASGAGKSMLLRCIAGLEKPNRGRIVLNDRVLFDSEKRIARRRATGASECCFKITHYFRIVPCGKTSLSGSPERRLVPAIRK